VVTMPGTLHWGFNTGVCVNIAQHMMLDEGNVFRAEKSRPKNVLTGAAAGNTRDRSLGISTRRLLAGEISQLGMKGQYIKCLVLIIIFQP